MTTQIVSQNQVGAIGVPGGRLTLESGVPVSSADQTSKTTIYYTPYMGNRIPLWTGSIWASFTFAETSFALGTLTSGKPYDVFGYLSAGALVLEALVWTNDTTRATAVTIQDGYYCKSGDKTRLYLGSFYTATATTTEDSVLNRYLWNCYSRVIRFLVQGVGASSHTYTSSTWRAYNSNTTTARVYFIQGIAELPVIPQYSANFYSTTVGQGTRIGAALNSTTGTDVATLSELTNVFNMQMAIGIPFTSYVGVAGRNYIQLVESVTAGTGNYNFGIIGGIIEA